MRTTLVCVALLVAVAVASHVNNANWRILNTQGVGMGKRDAITAVAFDKDVYIFGGIDESLDPTNLQPNVFYNEIFQFKTVSKRWVKKNPNPDPQFGFPDPRAFAIGGRNDRDFFVGFGISYNSDFSNIVTFNDLWAYNTITNTWKMLRAQGNSNGPIPRGQPAGEVYDGKVFLFGGVTDQFSSLDDFWTYDIASNVWTEHNPAVRPSHRHDTDFTLDRDNGRLWLYAGERCAFTDEGFSCVFAGPDAHWYLDLETNTWVQINALLTIPNRSSGNGAAFFDNKFFLYGGDLGGGNPCDNFITLQNNINETWTYNTNTNTWNQICPATRPPNLKRAKLVVVDDTVYMFGGFAFDSSICSPFTLNTDVWAFNAEGCEGGPTCANINAN